MIVQLTTRAKLELDSAVAFLSEASPRAADAFAARIEAALASLSHMPNRGRPGVIPGTRELLVRGTAYVIVYSASAGRVVVARIRHIRQDPAP